MIGALKCKSIRQLAKTLHRQGSRVSVQVGRALLHEAGYGRHTRSWIQLQTFFRLGL